MKFIIYIVNEIRKFKEKNIYILIFDLRKISNSLIQ